jgi:hypothetical protein
MKDARDGKNTHRNNWIRSLMNKGQKPLLKMLEVVPEELWEEAERWWIAKYRTWGLDLTNCADGGEGGNLTLETKEKLRISLAGKKRGPMPEETKQKISKANQGKPGSMIGKHHNLETRQKISESNKFFWDKKGRLTPEEKRQHYYESRRRYKKKKKAQQNGQS